MQKCWRDKEAKEKAASAMEKARNEKIVRLYCKGVEMVGSAHNLLCVCLPVGA